MRAQPGQPNKTLSQNKEIVKKNGNVAWCQGLGFGPRYHTHHTSPKKVH